MARKKVAEWITTKEAMAILGLKSRTMFYYYRMRFQDEIQQRTVRAGSSMILMYEFNRKDVLKVRAMQKVKRVIPSEKSVISGESGMIVKGKERKSDGPRKVI